MLRPHVNQAEAQPVVLAKMASLLRLMIAMLEGLRVADAN
jgi:hypothetical protein